jgi:hypothetical protein
MHQLSLFEKQCVTATRRDLDPTSSALLEGFRTQRLAEGAHPRSVQREISQLRSLAREAGTDDYPLPLATFIGDLPRVAQVLTEPQAPIARATGHARLIAIQRFMRIIGPTLNRDVEHDLAQLDSFLPGQHSAGWYTTGTLVAGNPNRTRPLHPALGWNELEQLVEATKDVGPTGLAA